MTRVLVTHADEPLGQRVTEALIDLPEVTRVFAVGEGDPPRAFLHLRGEGGRFSYRRAELAKHRGASDLFHSPSFRDAAIDTVLYVPAHGVATEAGSGGPGAPPRRTAEARIVLHHALEAPAVRSLVALGSAHVYRLAPGNANRLSEDSELLLDPGIAPEIRSWIDCDMTFQSEIRGGRLRIALLRLPAVVSSGGYVFLCPALPSEGGIALRVAGFDPLCAVIADVDAARAASLAAVREAEGVYNVAGREAVPLSLLTRWLRRPSAALPGGVLRSLGIAAAALGRQGLRARFEGDHLRFGFTLDTGRIERELGFTPSHAVTLGRGGDGRARLETTPL